MQHSKLVAFQFQSVIVSVVSPSLEHNKIIHDRFVHQNTNYILIMKSIRLINAASSLLVSFIYFPKELFSPPPATLHQIRKFVDSFSFPPILHSGDSMARILMSASLGVH